jgi:anti-sigma B factor antagonist
LAALPDEFKITIEDREGIPVIRVSGEIDLATHEELAGRLRAAAAKGKPVVVDLSACEFIDSSGIRALLLGEREAKSIAVAGASEQVRRVFEMTGVTQALEVHGTVEQALDSLR